MGRRLGSLSGIGNKFRRARGGGLLAACLRYHVTECVHLTKHFIEVLGRPPELRRVTLAMEQFHAVLDSVELVEKLRNRLTQFGCVGPSWRRCKHPSNVGTKRVFFKRRNVTGW
jgi:hypothetical protein